MTSVLYAELSITTAPQAAGDSGTDNNMFGVNSFVELGDTDIQILFDVKHDFRHQARIVAGGHVAPIPDVSPSSSVVSLKGVRLLLFLSQLNKLDLTCVDIGNVCFEVETTEKVFAVADPKFEKLEGRVLKIMKVLYSLKSSGARWHDVLADALRELGGSLAR